MQRYRLYSRLQTGATHGDGADPGAQDDDELETR
jgi:hypothetical protein